MVSPGGSLTGSFDQAVSWFSRLLPAQVKPDPDSETWNPKAWFAMTLIQGAGVHWPAPRIVTYSHPSFANPPRPLKNSQAEPQRRVAVLAPLARPVSRAGSTAPRARQTGAPHAGSP